MQTNEFERFNAVMNGMAKLYEREIDQPLLDAYWLALRDWPLEQFEQAAGHLMAHNKFMPRPAEFNELRKASKQTAGEAWAKVLQFARTGYTHWTDGGVTRTKAEPPDDPAIQRAVAAIGGYHAIAMSETSKTPFLERRFCENYDAMETAEEVRTALPSVGTFGLAALNKRLDYLKESKQLEKPPV